MQKDKMGERLGTMLAIKDGKSVVRTTEQSEFNQAAEANRPLHTYKHDSRKGRMLTQREMASLRRMEQLWPDDIQNDADSIRMT